VTEVTITDPHHALYGQRLELVSSSSARGPRHVNNASPSTASHWKARSNGAAVRTNKGNELPLRASRRSPNS
jgi:hypothetical protein